MSKYNRNDVHNALERVCELFNSDYRRVNREWLENELRQLAKGYRDYRALSDDTWMSSSQLIRAMKSIQADLRRAQRTMNHPMLLHHLDSNHPRRHISRSTMQDLSEALSAVGWALSYLDQDDSGGPKESGKRQRRTRTSTRDQYLIPHFTWMITQYWELDAESPWDMEEIESRVRVLLQEWPILTGNPDAETYHKISTKPLRRLIRAAAKSHSSGEEK